MIRAPKGVARISVYRFLTPDIRLARRFPFLRSIRTSVLRTKYRVEHLWHPCCLRERRRLRLRHKSHLHDFGAIRMLRTARGFCFKHSHHIRRPISVAVVHNEVGATEDAEQPREPNQKPRLLEHLANSRVSWNFSRLYRTTRQQPNVAFR